MPSNDALLQAIRERVNYETFFAEMVAPNTLQGNGRERRTKCIFHEDHNPSMGINIEEGLYKCYVPNCGAQGDFISFYQRKRSLTFSEAVHELALYVGLNPEEYSHGAPERDHAALAARNSAELSEYRARGVETPIEAVDRTIDPAVIEGAHQRLLAIPALMDWLLEKRGLARETIEQYKIGHDGQRYFIPITNTHGDYVNVRRYKPGADASDKMLSWRAGFGSARLFPLTFHSNNETVYLFEGEMDTLLARQNGLNAVTTTGGAGTWRDQWSREFAGRDVVICYDEDAAGRRGAQNVAHAIRAQATSIKVTRIPLAEPPGADFTNYIVDHGHTVGDFLALVEQTALYQSDEVVTPLPQEPEDVHLSAASEAQYHNQPVRLHIQVSGKTMAPYLLPKDVRMNCGNNLGAHPFCERCKVFRNGGPLNIELRNDTNEILQYVGASEKTIQSQLRTKAGVPSKCTFVHAEIINSMNVEEVQLIPEIDRSENETPYVTRTAFFVGHGLIPNRGYIMTGVTVPTPDQQIATHLLHTAEPAQSNIDAFSLTPAVREQLSQFSVPDTGGLTSPLWLKMNVIYADLEKMTRIYERRDIMTAVDLTFHSALSFRFQGETLVRGWIEALILGDSRTGKTTIVDRMMKHYGAGEFTTGENTSYAGLVGGLHQIGTTWNVSWGRVPLNDRRLLAIDEAGNMPTEQIGRMSAMRSSGIAEVTKIHTERTSARTRQIWVSNPRGNRPLSTYSQGVIAVKELIGAPEDIARFDIIATVASSDVGLGIVNASREMETPSTFTSTLCHQRVMWAWSRKRDDIVFTDGAVATVLLKATDQGKKYRYATEIPLVEPNEQRVKLARLAVAVAAMFFSTDESGDKIVVRSEHVQFGYEYLEKLYAKRSLAFSEYAEAARRRYELDDPEHKVGQIIRHSPGAAQSLMEQEKLTQRDFKELLAYDDNAEMRAALSELRDVGFLRRVGATFYVKTPAGIEWLRRELDGENNARELVEEIAASVSGISDAEMLAVAAETNGLEPEW